MVKILKKKRKEKIKKREIKWLAHEESKGREWFSADSKMIDSPRYLVNGARGDRLVFPSSSQQKDSGSMKEDGCSGLCRLLIVFPVIGLWTKPLFVTFCLMPPRCNAIPSSSLSFMQIILSLVEKGVVLIIKCFPFKTIFFSFYRCKIFIT